MTPTPAQRDALTRIADEFAGLARQIRVLTQPETPAQDTHTPRTAPQTRSGGTESGQVGLSGTCARCGAPITLPMSDPNNYEMAVCTSCEIQMLREGYRQARAQVERLEREARDQRAVLGPAIKAAGGEVVITFHDLAQDTEWEIQTSRDVATGDVHIRAREAGA